MSLSLPAQAGFTSKPWQNTKRIHALQENVRNKIGKERSAAKKNYTMVATQKHSGNTRSRAMPA
jgi:hypothetical protein